MKDDEVYLRHFIEKVSSPENIKLFMADINHM